MRVEQTIEIDAPRDEIWDVVTDPETYTRTLSGITRFDVEGPKQRGLGARYAMRMQVGSAEVGGLVEVVEFDSPSDMAWTSVLGLDHRGRWRLREQEDGSTRVTFRLSYQAPGTLLGTVADYVSSPIVERNLRESLENLKADIEGEQMADNDEPGLLEKARLTVGQGLHSVKTLAEAGLIRPERVDKTIRALLQIQRWGYTPAAGYAANAARYPNEDAIIDELGHLTFAEVHDRTNRLANAWSDAGIVEGDSIGIMCRNHRYFIEAVVAASKMGVNCLLLNTAFAGPQLAEVVQREKPVALVYDEEFTELLEEAGKRRKRFIGWHDPEATEEKRTDPVLEDLIQDGDTDTPVPPVETGRVVILTSGTTGTPKGAARKQPETIGPAVALLSRIPLKAREKTFIVAPLFHSWGFAHFTLGLMLASTFILRRKFDPEQTLSTIAQYQVQSAPMVPVMVQRIMQLPEETRKKYDTSSLRTIPLSGSALPGELAIKFMDEFGDVLYNLYGSTEVAWASIATPDDLREAPGTAGPPPRGTILKIYDEDGKELPQGETGRIFVGNEMLFEGYTGGGNKDVIDGLMSSGDVGYLDEEGRLHVSGRDDDMIVSGGENVFPREVEDLIAKMDGVQEVAVIGVDDEEFGQRLKAFVSKKGAKPTEDDIKAKVKADLARYKVPREVEFLDELPRNATGKVLKKELQEREENGGDGGESGDSGGSDGKRPKSKRSGGSRKKATAKKG
jgi:acyl-CoA synthetase (AMP-forming)/AMP-acid ligase II/carbon monoxide dehydrogenase subunit G